MTYTFAEFFAVWATIQKWKIPEVHLRIINYLEDEIWENDTKVLLLWRGIGKSTIVDLWVAYKLSVNPQLRFLILSSEHRTAKKGSQDILFIVRNHPLCRHLIANTLETCKDSFFVQGSTDKRNASVLAHGILSNVTGGRADYIIYDDVEVQKNSGSEMKREDLRRRIAETAHLLVPEIVATKVAGRRLFIGTYHDSISIYDEQIDGGANALKVALIEKPVGQFPNITGETNWPERFTPNTVKVKQLSCSGKAEFFSQYLLVPTSIKDAFLDISLLQEYDDEVIIKEVNKTVVARIGKHVIKSVSAWWDPAMSTARLDASVLAVVYTSNDGSLFVHRTIAVKGGADEQCIAVVKIAKDLNIPIVNIESNGIGNHLPQLLLKHLAGTGIGVDGIATKQNKNEKITEAFETPLYGGYIYISKQVKESPFIGQMRDFDPRLNNQKDDYIDSVASAIKQEPIRVAGNLGIITQGINTRWIGDVSVEIEMDKVRF